MQTSQTQSLVDLINNAYLSEFSPPELKTLQDLGCFEGDNRLDRAARIQLGAKSVIVTSPTVLVDGLIEAYAPCEKECSIVFPVSAIEAVYFTSLS